MFENGIFQPSRIGHSLNDIATYVEWDNWIRGTSGSSGSEEYVLHKNDVISCITIEIMIVDGVAKVYPEFQKPKKNMFEESGEDSSEEDHEDLGKNEEGQGKDDGKGLQGDFEMDLNMKDILPEMIQIHPSETLDDPRTETPDFHISNSPQVGHESPDNRPSCSSQIKGHENAPLFDTHSTITSSIKSQSGSAEPENMVTFNVEKYDYLFEQKNKWKRLKEFPTTFTNVVLNNEVVLDNRSYSKRTPLLKFIPRKNLDIDEDAIPMKKNTNKSEKQTAKAKKPAKKPHARTKKREETLEFSEDMQYCLTDIPQSRKELIYKEEHLTGPMRFLVEHHKAGGKVKASDPDDDFIEETIWPELKLTYKFAEIMKRPKNNKSAPWSSTRKPF